MGSSLQPSRRRAALESTAHYAPSVAAFLARGREVLRSPSRALGAKRGLLGHFGEHGRSLRSECSLLAMQVPWIPFIARDFVAKRLPPRAAIAEFGSGGSTLHWLRIGATVVSVEHDPVWAQLTEQSVANEFRDRLDFRPIPVLRHPNSVTCEPYTAWTSDEYWQAYDFTSYVSALHDLPDESLDLLVVDGRSRVRCLKASLGKVKPSGMILFDNTDRAEYGEALKFASQSGWTWKHFLGPVPCMTSFSQSSVALKRK